MAASIVANLCLSAHAYTLQDLTPYANPLCGTENGCNLFPGVVVPFGMMQWSPDTPNGVQYGSEQGGYLYTDTQIVGFSFNHLSGAGGDYGGDCAFTPLLGNVTASPASNSSNGNTANPSTYSHANEVSAPGYYSVVFNNGIQTELTASTRTGFGRFTYPAGSAASLLINAGSGASIINASLTINASGYEVSGWTTGEGFLGSGQNHTVYFDIIFDHAFTSYGTWNAATLSANSTSAAGSKIGAYLTFNLPAGGAVLARAGISWVSVANAKANLAAENPAATFNSSGFTAMKSAASANWNAYLNKIQVSGGTTADLRTFYSMLYHSLFAPSVVSDTNNQYIGFDGAVHTTSGYTKYEYFSGWDIYRNECQLIAMLDPARASDMAQSLVQDYTDSGAMPRWSIPTGDTGIMIGDDATAIIAGLYAFGATNFSTSMALADMVDAALDYVTVADNGVVERDAERDYLNLGFVPQNEIGGYGPVSMTLEYCSDDCALALFAKALGDTANYTLAMSRAQNWRNLYNSSSGYFQMRASDAAWSPGFPTYGGSGFVEGTAYQYVWLVPFNLGSLAYTMGGTQAAASRLNTFFTQLNDNDTTNSQYCYMGNEPCSETPYIYDFLGQPYMCSQVVRACMTQLFSSAPGGLPGNDDLGQMSSWYVWAALGMHPEIPGDDVLVMNGPLFPQTVIHLANGDVTITGLGASDSAPYIQSLTVNGEPSSSPWVRFASIANGATLAYTMGTSPNTGWGADLSLAPPSYTDGMTAPIAPNYFWGTGLESSDYQPTWTNTVDTTSPGGDISNVGPVSVASSPELGVRNENAQSGSSELMYSGSAQGGKTTYAYLKAFDLSSQSITITAGMHLSYWIFPQSAANSSFAFGRNSAYEAVDLIFTDLTTLRDSGLTDQHGVGIHPADQGTILVLDEWNYVTVDLSPLAGETVNRLDVGYDQPGSTGDFRGYVDDIAFTIPGTTGAAFAPTASVTATVPQAAAMGQAPGVFSITLSTVAAFDVSVQLTLGGTAAPGTDYTAAPGISSPSSVTVLIPAGATTGTLTITPAANPTPTATDKTITATIATAGQYQVNAAAAVASITLEEDSPYSPAWLALYQPAGFYGVIAAPTADPAHDGISNLLKFAFNMDPLVFAPAGSLPQIGSGLFSNAANGGALQHYATLTFTERTDAPNLSYTVQASPDLTNNVWSATPVFVSSSTAGMPANTEQVVYRAAQPFDGPDAVTQMFLRVSVTAVAQSDEANASFRVLSLPLSRASTKEP